MIIDQEINEIIDYCEKKLNVLGRYSIKKISKENFIIEFEFKKFLVLISFRGLYNTDFEIGDIENQEVVYSDFLFYGNSRFIKFSPEIIIVDWKNKLDAVIKMLLSI